MTTSTKPLHEGRIEEPAKAWRTWWIDREDSGGCDEPYADCDVWPSKDVAESKAQSELLDDYVSTGTCPSKWLGAFPEGQRP